jgi:hypothetical protein
MNEAQGLKDAFRGWTTIQRDKRLMEMAKLINRYAMLAMDLTIDISAFNRILKRPKRLFKNPYAVAFAHIPTWVLASGSQRKTIEKIELIFDRGVLSRDDAIRDSYIGMMTHLPPNLTALLHGRPRFEDDKEVLPLQAADLWAWHVRRQHFEAMNGNRWESPVWSELTKINTRTIHLGERELTEYRDRLVRRGVQFQLVGFVMPNREHYGFRACASVSKCVCRGIYFQVLSTEFVANC